MSAKLNNCTETNFYYFVNLAKETAKNLGNNLVNNTVSIAKFFIEGYNKTVENFPAEANIAINCETMNEIVSGTHFVPLPAAITAACVGMVAVSLLEKMSTNENSG